MQVYRCRSEGIIYCCSKGHTEQQLLGWFEPSVKAEVAKLTSGDFLDVGANIGVHAVRAAARLGERGRVVAIEPHPIFQDLLHRTIAENQLTNIKVVKAAAWSQEDTLVLYEHVFGGERIDHSVVHKVSGNSTPVAATTVDAIVESEKLDKLALVKIDVEGAEVQVFQGMSNTLKRFPALRIVFEALTGANLRASSEVLAKYDYRIRRLPDGNYLAIGPQAPSL